MSVRTPEEFSQWLQDELSWRRKELHLNHSWVARASSGERQAILRGAITVLYAHWEGFVKSAGERYLEYVRLRRLRANELSRNFIAVFLHQRLQQAEASKKVSLHLELIDFFLSRLGDRVHLPKEGVVSTRSNLSVEVFRDILLLLGLEYRADYALAEKPIIERLLYLRNGIAHGETREVNPREYEQLYVKIDNLLVLFCNDVDNAVSPRKYRR